MKWILFVFVTAVLVGCGGGGGGNVQNDDPMVQVDDPTGIQAAIEATGYSDSTSFLRVVEDGLPEFVDEESLDARSQAVDTGIRGRSASLTYQRAGERGGLPHYRLRGPLVLDVEGQQINLNAEEYGAWGEHQTFAVTGLEATAGGSSLIEFWASSGGRFSESNPVGDMGTATWRGAMIGESGGKFLSGDSTIGYDFSAATVDVRMSGIRDWNTPQTYPDLVWEGLDVRNGTFTDAYTIRGSFYGPNHQEAGGVFDRRNITGAFGAKRE